MGYSATLITLEEKSDMPGSFIAKSIDDNKIKQYVKASKK